MKSKTGKVLIAAPVHPILIEGLAGIGYNCVMAENISQSSAHTLIKDCIGAVTSTRLQFDKELIDAAPQLRWIGRMGSGMEVIDLAYAAGRGVACFGSPEGNCNAVGEHALGMLLTLIRRITWSHNEIIQGQWRREENRGVELEGKTVGIIGFGNTGAAFAKKLMGFDVRILAYDKYKSDSIPDYILKCSNLEDLLLESDIISFHVPLQDDTIHYVNDAFIAKVRKPFILINTSRGAVVDMLALHRGIKNGRILGACLDVFEQEPVAAMKNDIRIVLNEMLASSGLVVTPHIAGYTYEALYKMSKILLEKITLL